MYLIVLLSVRRSFAAPSLIRRNRRPILDIVSRPPSALGRHRRSHLRAVVSAHADGVLAPDEHEHGHAFALTAPRDCPIAPSKQASGRPRLRHSRLVQSDSTCAVTTTPPFAAKHK